MSFGGIRRTAISIHAPRVGSDDGRCPIRRRLQRISIHAPRVGSDICSFLTYCVAYRFQSTLPVWGATSPTIGAPQCPQNFNPRSPCGERPEFAATFSISSPISIHAPRVGSDHRRDIGRRQRGISIHAPRVGSDPHNAHTPCSRRYFNPRSPCGERPISR